ncbi:MAG: helix-turn-helix domain-containing protein [Flavobacteriales bacterium]|jgi:transcriptional regulator with XRE-family HTH domain|nr:helix-turn-helix domain-containing protein [Flavobacteriales bacterium]
MDLKRLKELRILRGMTQEAVAHAIGLDTSQYCRIENGDRKLSAEEASALASLYKCTVDVVVGRAAIVSNGESVSPHPASSSSAHEQFLQDQLDKRDQQLDRSQSLLDKMMSFIIGRLGKDSGSDQHSGNQQQN